MMNATSAVTPLSRASACKKVQLLDFCDHSYPFESLQTCNTRRSLKESLLAPGLESGNAHKIQGFIRPAKVSMLRICYEIAASGTNERNRLIRLAFLVAGEGLATSLPDNSTKSMK